jgi:hypothetical protein
VVDLDSRPTSNHVALIQQWSITRSNIPAVVAPTVGIVATVDMSSSLSLTENLEAGEQTDG